MHRPTARDISGSQISKIEKHPWILRAHFQACACSGKLSMLAFQSQYAVVTEIKRVVAKAPVIGVEKVVRLRQR